MTTSPGKRASERFGFERPERGAGERYHERRAFWWIVHNAIAHPLIAFVPRRPFFRFHDWTSYKMHGQDVAGQGSAHPR